MKTPHKHAEIIKAWADGSEIQYWDVADQKWKKCGDYFQWIETCNFRIKPEPKPDITKTFLLENHCFAGFRFNEATESSRQPRQQWIRAVFDGETAQIKSVEVLHE